MPTRNRARLFERALGSVIGAADDIEVRVSDESDDDATGQVVERLLADWPGGYQYVHNRPALPLVDNMNRAAELATWQWGATSTGRTGSWRAGGC
jgi:glycosyltransferase involved in cell wall biosynthesis